ncbi:hypothetical protein EC988_007091, partial [Linderina pennispora]
MSTGSSSTVDAIIKGIFSGSLTDAKYQYLSIIGLLYQAGINIAIGAGAFLVFVVLRPTNARVYARRYKHMKGSRRPPKIGKGYFAWVPVLWRADEQYIFDNIGLDSVMFLRFFKLGIILMGIFMIIGTC